MSPCPKCQYELRPHESVSRLCPSCGVELKAKLDERRWSSIARLTNLAEVGYIADVLEGRDIPTNVVQHNEFSALEGGWQSIFILQVPQELGESAMEALSQDLDEREPFVGQNEGDQEESLQSGASAAVHWRPVMLALMAGGIAYCAGRGSQEQFPPQRPSKGSLWRALSESDSPLISDQGPGATRRFLRYDRSSGALLLEEDFDRDGRWDRIRRFQNGRLVSEVEY